MKKLLIALFCVVVAATAASADIGISWATINGVAWHGADASVLAGSFASGESLLDRYSAIWQLIWTGADGEIDAATTSAGGAGYADNYVTDDDQVLAQRDISLNGTTTTELGATPGTEWNNWMVQANGSSTAWSDLTLDSGTYTVYQRVFEDTPAAGTWYYTSGTLTADQWVLPAAETTFSLDTDDALVQPTEQFAVPEPATMSLLGLGALVMAIRRRRS